MEPGARAHRLPHRCLRARRGGARPSLGRPSGRVRRHRAPALWARRDRHRSPRRGRERARRADPGHGPVHGRVLRPDRRAPSGRGHGRPTPRHRSAAHHRDGHRGRGGGVAGGPLGDGAPHRQLPGADGRRARATGHLGHRRPGPHPAHAQRRERAQRRHRHTVRAGRSGAGRPSPSWWRLDRGCRARDGHRGRVGRRGRQDRRPRTPGGGCPRLDDPAVAAARGARGSP